VVASDLKSPVVYVKLIYKLLKQIPVVLKQFLSHFFEKNFDDEVGWIFKVRKQHDKHFVFLFWYLYQVNDSTNFVEISIQHCTLVFYSLLVVAYFQRRRSATGYNIDCVFCGHCIVLNLKGFLSSKVRVKIFQVTLLSLHLTLIFHILILNRLFKALSTLRLTDFSAVHDWLSTYFSLAVDPPCGCECRFKILVWALVKTVNVGQVVIRFSIAIDKLH